MKSLKPILFILLLVIITSCGIFKTRVVNTNKKDSTETSKSSSNLSKGSSNIDTSKKKTVTYTALIDSSETDVTITPTPGIPFTVDSSGVFHGQATNVDIKTKGKKKINTKSTSEEQKGVTQTTKSDSVGTLDKKTEVSSKTKSITATPDYKWIIYLVGIILILGFAAYCYYHFILKKTI